MRNNVINKISPNTRIISLFILVLSLLMANSIFLILFITTLTLILIVITGKKVKSYVNILKKNSFLLLFLLVIYIIIFEWNIFSVLVFAYKLIIATLLFSVFYFNSDFNQLHQSIYSCFKPLEKINVDVEQFSFDFVLALYFIKKIVNKKEQIWKTQVMYGKKQLNIRNYILPVFISAAYELNQFQYHLKTNFYKLSYKSNDSFSKIILILFEVLFIFVVFKEVIL